MLATKRNSSCQRFDEYPRHSHFALANNVLRQIDKVLDFDGIGRLALIWDIICWFRYFRPGSSLGEFAGFAFEPTSWLAWTGGFVDSFAVGKEILWIPAMLCCDCQPCGYQIRILLVDHEVRHKSVSTKRQQSKAKQSCEPCISCKRSEEIVATSLSNRIGLISTEKSRPDANRVMKWSIVVFEL